MDIAILFAIICLSVYAVNWVANLFHDETLDPDDLELLLEEEEKASSNENKV